MGVGPKFLTYFFLKRGAFIPGKVRFHFEQIATDVFATGTFY